MSATAVLESPTEVLTFDAIVLKRILDAENAAGSASVSMAATAAFSRINIDNNSNNSSPATSSAASDENSSPSSGLLPPHLASKATAASAPLDGPMIQQVSSSGSMHNDSSNAEPPLAAAAAAAAASAVAPNAAACFSRIMAAGDNGNWALVAALTDDFAKAAQSNRAARHALIELAQGEFEAAFATKNIVRRERALITVAHMFRAKLVSEKVVVSALHRAVGEQPQQQQQHSTPLWALLAVARALTVASSSFSACGLQHLPSFISLLALGICTCTPSQKQHSEICEAIRVNSAVLHGFRAT
jgi:hypothetical protein